METRTVEQVENWSTRPFTDGYAGLRELSDGEFSGAVRAGGAWLFMLNGRIIGVFEGSLDDFQQADGTAYAAPHPSLPLLFSMQEQGGETQAKYYTNDTPLSEVDSTLTSGKFTGFVELSENVLSGDYYVAYYGGRSMSVAFVGASEQVVTGDEAFDRAKDEVGIYEVRDVDVEVTDVPEPEETDDAPDDSPDASVGGATDTSGAADAAGTGGSSGTSASAGDGASTSDSPDESTNASATGDAGGVSSSGRTPSSASAPETAESTTAETSGAAPDSSPEAAEASTETDASPGSDTPTSARDDSSVDTPPSSSDTSTSSGDTQTGQTASSSASGSPGESTSGGRTADDRDTDATQTADAARTTDASRTADAGAGQAVESSSSAGASESAPTTDAAIEEAETSAEAESGVASAPESKSESEPTPDSATAEAAATDDDPGEQSDAFSEEAEWRETTTIPSLDPDRSDGPGDEETDSAAGGAAETDRRAKSTPSSQSASSGQSRSGKSRSGKSQSGQSRSGQSRSSQSRSGQSRPGQSRSDRSQTSKPAESRQSSAQSGEAASSSGSASASASGTSTESPSEATSGSPSGEDSGSGPDAEEVRERIQKLRSQLSQRKQQVEQLKERLSTLESERNEYKRERDALTQEVERLEAKLERAESGESGEGGRRLSKAQAFDGTNLFVRYQSKGKSTLDEAAEGKVDADDVNANLRLEHHTQFEADDVTVAGESFEAFLTDSFEYRFVSWVVEELLYEIRDTGHRNGLQDLYEAIPKIDRVDLHGDVSAGGADEDTRQESFDVIMRDRMGNPLVVADLNGSREPTTGDMMGSLVDAASGVGEKYDELAGAFQVTESFFEPEALETTETATSGGFLSREKRESFVKLSRKRGYHLCLVESRSGGFHLNVPEL